jgi:hypothetical protein
MSGQVSGIVLSGVADGAPVAEREERESGSLFRELPAAQIHRQDIEVSIASRC